MGGLPNVTITKFDLPGDAPGGIALAVQNTIINSSPFGLDLGNVSFLCYFEGS
jgi:hypothetical protein